MRLDKFLKVSRLIKRRTLAKEVAVQGRITINGKVAKASTPTSSIFFKQVAKSILSLLYDFNSSLPNQLRARLPAVNIFSKASLLIFSLVYFLIKCLALIISINAIALDLLY